MVVATMVHSLRRAELASRKNNNGGVPREVGLGDTLSRTDIVQASEIFYM
jgi:hypothetical protein